MHLKQRSFFFKSWPEVKVFNNCGLECKNFCQAPSVKHYFTFIVTFCQLLCRWGYARWETVLRTARNRDFQPWKMVTAWRVRSSCVSLWDGRCAISHGKKNEHQHTGSCTNISTLFYWFAFLKVIFSMWFIQLGNHPKQGRILGT